MKKVVQTLSLLLVLLLSACGANKETDANSEPAQSTQSETSEKKGAALKDGVLSFATNATFPPYEYYEGSEIVGIDVDIARAIAEQLGYEFKITDMEFDNIVLSVQNGKVQAGIAGMSVTPEREENVDFSDPYTTAVQAIIVPENSTIVSADDLSGKKIGTQLGTTGDIYCQDDFGVENVTSFNSGPDAVMALQNGKIDAVVIDKEPAKNYVAANPGLKVLESAYAEESYAIALPKGNDALLKEINTALNVLKESGALQEIIDRYISGEK